MILVQNRITVCADKYKFIYYRAENPIRRVDATEKVLILHKTVQGKAYLYVLHYYILYVKTVFQCPRLTSVGVVQGENIITLKEYRYPIRLWQTELPGGLIDPGETAEQAAVREL